MELVYARLSPRAIPPKPTGDGSVGYEMYSATDTFIPAYGKQVVPTDIALCLPKCGKKWGVLGRLVSRSQQAYNLHIQVSSGIIDPSYHNNIFVILFNHSDTDYYISHGDCIARLILEFYQPSTIREISIMDVYQE